MRWIIALLLSLSLLYACLPEPKTSHRTIVLDHEMFDPTVNRHYYTPFIGWDSVPDSTSVLILPELGKAKVKIQTKDVVLNRRDSIRIGVIHPIEKINGDTFDIAAQDYLLLSSYGVDNIPLSLNHPGLGIITRRTFFRVGRDFYRLASVDSTRTLIEIEPMESVQQLPIAASIDIRFKRVPVITMQGEETTIRHQEGRDLVIYFWGLGPHQGDDLVALDSLYRQLPTDYPLDIVAVSRTDSQKNLEQFLADNDLKIPVYKASPETCEGLNCHPMLPYGFLVNASGRIIAHNFRDYLLNAMLLYVLEKGDKTPSENIR